MNSEKSKMSKNDSELVDLSGVFKRLGREKTPTYSYKSNNFLIVFSRNHVIKPFQNRLARIYRKLVRL